MLLLLLLLFVGGVSSAFFDGTADFAITDIAKTRHAHNSGGFNRSYAVDGNEQAVIEVIEGQIASLTTAGLAASYPIYLSTDLDGDGAAEVSGGIAADSGAVNHSYAANGNTFRWTAQANQTLLRLYPRLLYYQSRFESRMGWKVIISPFTECQLLADLRGLSFENSLLAYTNATLGALFGDLLLLPLYASVVSTRNSLAAAYVSFLAGPDAFDCQDDSIDAYDGDTLEEIHVHLPITQALFARWVDLWESTAVGLDGPTDHRFRKAFSPMQARVCPSACYNSVCDRYSNLALGTGIYRNNGENYAWLSTVITSAVNNMIDPTSSPIANQFRDLAFDSVALAGYVNDLVRYFGQSSKLNCTNADFPVLRTNESALIAAGLASRFTESDWIVARTYILQSLDINGVNPQEQDALAALFDEEDVDPTVPTPKPRSKQLSGFAIVAIVLGSLLVVVLAIFAIIRIRVSSSRRYR